jgi:tripartite-type tricarboxylate transporter receptor subunit TctC
MLALFAPARTPAEINKKIADDVSEVVKRPEIKALLAARGFDVQGTTAAELQRIIDKDTLKWQKVLETAKIKDKINAE